MRSKKQVGAWLTSEIQESKRVMLKLTLPLSMKYNRPGGSGLVCNCRFRLSGGTHIQRSNQKAPWWTGNTKEFFILLKECNG